jgi:hypothetical protein
MVIRHAGLAWKAELVPLDEHVDLLDYGIHRVFVLDIQRDVLDQVEVVYNLHDALIQLKILGGEELVHISEAFFGTQGDDLVQQGLILVVVLDTLSSLL